MKQSINLYPESLRPKQDPLALARVGRGLGLLLFFLAVYSAYLYYDLSQLNVQSSAQMAQMKQIEQSQAQLEENLAASLSSQLLDQQLKQSEQSLRVYQRLIRQLSQQQEVESLVFSSYLEGLARQSVNKTWLTRIALAEGGARFVLEGLSLSADQVPQWVLHMKQDPVFAGKTFASLEMVQIEEPTTALRFTIASHLENEDEPE